MSRLFPAQPSYTFKRCIAAWPLGSQCQFRFVNRRNYSQENSSDSSENPSAQKNEEKLTKKQVQAKQKLSDLILSMKVAPSLDVASSISINLAKPKARVNKPKQVKEQVPKEPQEEQIAEKPVIDETLVQAAKDVASALGDDVQKTESELLQRLKASAEESIAVKSSRADRPATNFSDLFVGMKIDRSKPRVGTVARPDVRDSVISDRAAPPSYVKRSPIRQRNQASPLGLGPKVGLFTGDPLNAFTVQPKPPEGLPETKTWNQLQEKELQLLTTHPPVNAYEEMIQWTEKGRLWTFPINNEVGLEEEASIPFHEHIFLEHLLEEFPKEGPIRHFMELVINGLSKNPYMTVERKHEHVLWYKQYFKEKEEVLKVCGLALQ